MRGDAGMFDVSHMCAVDVRGSDARAFLRRLLATERKGAGPGLVIRVWRELMGDSLAGQGPYHVSVWGGRDPGRVVGRVIGLQPRC